MSWMRRLPALLIDSAPILVLAGLAAAGSFSHIRHLAATHGQTGWKAWATAVCIDLLCVMAARERHRDARIGRRCRGLLSWPTLVLTGGIVLTLAANLAEAGDGVWAHVLAAVPAAAFLVAVSMLERRAAYVPDEAAGPVDAPPVPAADRVPVEVSSPVPLHTVNGHQVESPRPEVGPASDLETPVLAVHGPEEPSPASSPAASAGPGPSPALVTYARQVAKAHLAQHGKPITRDQLRARLRVGTDLATALLREVRTETV